MSAKDAINDTLARLDEAIGAKRNYSFTVSKDNYFNEDDTEISISDATNFIDRTLSVGFSETNVSKVVKLDDYDSYIMDDVTAPFCLMSHDVSLNNTTAAILAQDDPGAKATQILFSEFVNIFVSHPSEMQIWEEIAAYERVTAQQAESLRKVLLKAPKHHSNFSRTEQMQMRMVGERNTWRLIGSLFYEKLMERCEEDDEDKLFHTILEKTDKTVIEKLYDTSQKMREAQIVIDWLEKNAMDSYEDIYSASINWFGNNYMALENTLRTIKSEKEREKSGNRNSSYGIGGMKPLITSLDPDAPVRQGKPLHQLDKEIEDKLLQFMFTCIRAGQIADAQELCSRIGQHWRAATLEGWKLHHDPNLFANATSTKPITGNPQRDVWKAVSWSIASDKRFSSVERAIYGCLCGHFDSVVNMCQNWEDLLWAYLRTNVDQMVEETLRAANTHLRPMHPLPKEYPEQRLSLTQIFESIESRMGGKGPENPYHTLQKYLILDDIDGLVRTGHKWLAEEGFSPHLLRCLTHVLLVLKKLARIPADLDELTTHILHACVKEAIERGDVEQVAWYTSVLPPWLQVRCYTNFLSNISEEQHRKHALNLASLVGLDVHAITTTVVTTIRLSTVVDVGSSGDLVTDMTAEDRVKINALDWLLYDPRQRQEALKQCNAMLRTFLISRKISASKALFQKIPSDSIEITMKQQCREFGDVDMPSSVDNIIREYLSFKTFLEAQESFTDWFDHFYQKKPVLSSQPAKGCSFSEQLAYEHATQQHYTLMSRWKRTLENITKASCERLYNVLLFPDGGWLVDLSCPSPPLGEGEQRGEDDEKRHCMHLQEEVALREPNRKRQVQTLRSIYIPQVISLLQNILHCTKKHKECIQLADLITSDHHQLHKAFSKGEIQRFLLKLQETSKELLDKNFDALGYPLN